MTNTDIILGSENCTTSCRCSLQLWYSSSHQNSWITKQVNIL